MEISTLATAAVAYLVDSIKNSKGSADASGELTTAIWNWIRPIFLRDDEPVKDLEENPDNQDNQDEVKLKIKKHLDRNPKSKEELIKIFQDDKLFSSPTFNLTHYGMGDNVAGNKTIINKK